MKRLLALLLLAAGLVGCSSPPSTTQPSSTPATSPSATTTPPPVLSTAIYQTPSEIASNAMATYCQDASHAWLWRYQVDAAGQPYLSAMWVANLRLQIVAVREANQMATQVVCADGRTFP